MEALQFRAATMRNFYKMSFFDWLFATSLVIVLLITYHFIKFNLSLKNLIDALLPVIGTLCGFLLTAIAILTALWNQDSMDMVRKAKDSAQIYFLPLACLNQGIILIFLMSLGFFIDAIQNNIYYEIIVIFFLVLFIIKFLRFLHLLKIIFKWIVAK